MVMRFALYGNAFLRIRTVHTRSHGQGWPSLISTATAVNADHASSAVDLVHFADHRSCCMRAGRAGVINADDQVDGN